MRGKSSVDFWPVVLAVLVCLGLSGCESKVTQENFDKIELGMSRRKVEQILGKGDDIDANTTVWRSGNSEYTITYREGEVAGKAGKTVSGGTRY